MMEEDSEQQWRRGSPWNIETTQEQDQQERASWLPICPTREYLSYLTAREIAAFVVPRPHNYDVPIRVQRVTFIGWLPQTQPPVWVVESKIHCSLMWEAGELFTFGVTQHVTRHEGQYSYIQGRYMRFPEEENEE